MQSYGRTWKLNFQIFPEPRQCLSSRKKLRSRHLPIKVEEVENPCCQSRNDRWHLFPWMATQCSACEPENCDSVCDCSEA
mmetsp:Transcript_157189/g.277544  ORF Transcript_157189/g.277544 Transcript_157189/m.277544 type:complete len:80 (-) Transcript_157189:51-290(-)